MKWSDVAWPARVGVLGVLVFGAAYWGGIAGALLAAFIAVLSEAWAWREHLRADRRIAQLESDLADATRPLTFIEQQQADEAAMQRQDSMRYSRYGDWRQP